MATIRPEVTGRKSGGSGTTAADIGIGHNRGPPLEPAYWVELQRIVDLGRPRSEGSHCRADRCRQEIAASYA